MRTLLCLLLLATPTAQVATLSGRVTNPAGKPIAGATVVLSFTSGSERSATTDRRGAYRFEGLRPANYRVRAGAAGFAPEEKSVYVADVEQAVSLSLGLTPWTQVPWAVYGTARRADTSAPVAGVRVYLYPAAGRPGDQAATGADGLFSFRSLRPGAYWIRADAPGYSAARDASFTLDEKTSRRKLDILLMPPPPDAAPGQIPLVVLDAEGRPLTGATVTLNLTGDARDAEPEWLPASVRGGGRRGGHGGMMTFSRSASVQPDAAGALSLPAFPGIYTLGVSAEGSLQGEAPVTVPPGRAAAPITLRLRRAPAPSAPAAEPAPTPSATVPVPARRPTAELGDPLRPGDGKPPSVGTATPSPAPRVPTVNGGPRSAAQPGSAPAQLRGIVRLPDGKAITADVVYVFTIPVDPGGLRPRPSLMLRRPLTAVPDDKGWFTGRGLFTGAQWISVKPEGFAETAPVRVEVPRGGTVEAVFVSAGPSLWAGGRVLDGAGKPLPGAVVMARRVSDDPVAAGAWEVQFPRLAQTWLAHKPADLSPGAIPAWEPGVLGQGLYGTYTDTQGRFILDDLDPGTYDFGAAASGWATAMRQDVRMAAGERPPEVSLTLGSEAPPEVASGLPAAAPPRPPILTVPLEREGALFVRLKGPDGRRLRATWMRITRVEPTGRGRTIRNELIVTDAGGVYRWSPLQPGPYGLSIQVYGYAAAHFPKLDIASGKETRIDVRLQRGSSLRGRVRRPDGAPAVWAMVRCQRRAGWLHEEVHATAGADGAFEVSGLGRGTWHVQARLAGFAPFEQVVEVPGRRPMPLDLAVDPAVSVRGVVRDASGQPARGVGVTWSPRGLDGSPFTDEHIRVVTVNTQGEFRLAGVPAGPVTVQVLRTGRALATERRALTGQSGEVAVDLVVPASY